MADNPTPGYDFVVYFYHKASKIEVYDKNHDTVDGDSLTGKHFPEGVINHVSKLNTLTVVHKATSNPGSNPCCVEWGGEKFCWC